MDLNLAILTKVIKLGKTSIDITPDLIRIKRKQRISFIFNDSSDYVVLSPISIA